MWLKPPTRIPLVVADFRGWISWARQSWCWRRTWGITTYTCNGNLRKQITKDYHGQTLVDFSPFVTFVHPWFNTDWVYRWEVSEPLSLMPGRFWGAPAFISMTSWVFLAFLGLPSGGRLRFVTSSWGMSATGHSITRPRSKQFCPAGSPSPKLESPDSCPSSGWDTSQLLLEYVWSTEDQSFVSRTFKNCKWDCAHRSNAMGAWMCVDMLGRSRWVMKNDGKPVGLIHYFSLDTTYDDNQTSCTKNQEHVADIDRFQQ